MALTDRDSEDFLRIARMIREDTLRNLDKLIADLPIDVSAIDPVHVMGYGAGFTAARIAVRNMIDDLRGS